MNIKKSRKYFFPFATISYSKLIYLFVFLFCNDYCKAKDVFFKMPMLDIEVVKPISESKILPDRLPQNTDYKKDIVVTACRGEFEPASFILRSRNLINDFQIKIKPLYSANDIISSKNISVRVVKVWYQGGSAWKGIYLKPKKTPVLVPELLLNDNALVKVDRKKQKNYIKLVYPDSEKYKSISDPSVKDKWIIYKNKDFPVLDAKTLLPMPIEAEETKQFWITVKVPLDAKEGTYTGSLELKTGRKTLHKINLVLEVLPFDLLEPNLTYSIYYRGRLAGEGGTISSEFKSPDQLRADLINIRNHGVTNPNVFQLNIEPSQGLYRFSKNKEYQLLRDYLAIRKDVGFTEPELYLLNTTGNRTDKASLEKLSHKVEELKGLIKDYGLKELFLYGKDEAKGAELISQRLAWRKVREAGGKIFTAGYKKSYESLAELTDLLVLHGALSRQDALNVSKLGNKIFSYHNPQSGPENPLIFRRNYGLSLWQAGYNGAMIYAYQHAGGGGSIWNDFDNSRTRDHNFTYPTVNEPIDTLAWEGFREGVDDVRYISTLMNLIKQVKLSKSENIQVKLAEGFLVYLKNAKIKDLDDMRRTLIGHIIQISRLNSNPKI